jgi:Skp family chaperone for outer membrane proteins
MKTIAKSALFAAAIFAATPTLAQTGPVLTVDINNVLSNSAAGKSGSAQLQAKYTTLVTGQQNAFNTAATNYNTQVEAARKVVKPDGSLPDANRTALGTAEQTLRTAQETLERTQQELNAVNNYVRDQIVRAVVPAAEAIRAERRASAVIPRNAVLAADPAGDVTSVVIQRVDAALKTVSITLPQAPAANARPAAQPQGR